MTSSIASRDHFLVEKGFIFTVIRHLAILDNGNDIRGGLLIVCSTTFYFAEPVNNNIIRPNDSLNLPLPESFG